MAGGDWFVPDKGGAACGNQGPETTQRYGVCTFQGPFGFFRRGDRARVHYDSVLQEYHVYSPRFDPFGESRRFLLCIPRSDISGRDCGYMKKERVRLEGVALVLRNAGADDSWARNIISAHYEHCS
jgi:hypothetical protein